MQEIAEEAETSTGESGVGINHRDLESNAQQDMNLLAGLAAPEEVDSLYPAFYIFIWKAVTASLFKVRDFSKYAIALPRGHGKTFVVKLLILFVILFTKRRYVMVIGAKQEHAINIIADVFYARSP